MEITDNSSPGVVKNPNEYFDLLPILHYTLSLPPFKGGEDKIKSISKKISSINPVFSFDEDERAIDFISKDFSLFKDKNRYRNFSIIESILKIAQENKLFPHMDYVYILYVNQNEKKFIDNETPPNSVKNLLFPSYRSQFPALDILNALRNYQINTLKILDDKFMDDVKKISTILRNGKNENGDQLISGIITSNASYMKDGKELKGEDLFDYIWEEYERYIDKIPPLADQPTEETLLLDVLSREILSIYLLEKRKELKGFQDILLDDKEKEFPFIREISIDYEERTRYEKCNSILLAQEGELFLSIYLYRMAIVYWKSELTNEAGRFPENTDDMHFQTFKNFLNNNSSDANQSIITEILKRIGLIKDESHLTSASSSMFRWFHKVCSDSDNFGSLKESLFKDKGLKLNESQLKELDEISKKLSNDGKNKGSQGLLSDLSKFFGTLLSEYHKSEKPDNQIIPLDFVELSRVFHVDPFVVNISMAHHEFQLNENKTKNTRHLLIFPIDPIILSTDNQHEMDDLSYEGIYALWIGYLEKPLQDFVSFENGKIDYDIVCIKTILNQIGQPIVRQIIEYEIIKAKNLEREANIQKAKAKEYEKFVLGISHTMGNDFNAFSGMLEVVMSKLKRKAKLFDLNKTKNLFSGTLEYFKSNYTEKFSLLSKINRDKIIVLRKPDEGNLFTFKMMLKESFFIAFMSGLNKTDIANRLLYNISSYRGFEDYLKNNKGIKFPNYMLKDVIMDELVNLNLDKNESYIDLIKKWNSFYSENVHKWLIRDNNIEEKDLLLNLHKYSYFILSTVLSEILINMLRHGKYRVQGLSVPLYEFNIEGKDNKIKIKTSNPIKNGNNRNGVEPMGIELIKKIAKSIIKKESVINFAYNDCKRNSNWETLLTIEIRR